MSQTTKLTKKTQSSTLQKKSKKKKPIKTDDYVIAIPSYKRADSIKDKTLKVLEEHKIDISRIYIFIANKEEEKVYKTSLDPKYHSRIVIGKLRLSNQRNFITTYFSEGKCIVQLDDDIEGIYELHHPTKKPKSQLTYKDMIAREFRKKQTIKPIKSLDQFIKNTFSKCSREGIYLWGVYPTANPYFMTFKSDEQLNFIVGPMFGIINRHNPKLKITMDEKEDSERTLNYYMMDGKVLRINYVTIKTKYYGNKGGMQADGIDRKAAAKKATKALHKKFPDITKLYTRKSTGMPEIRLLRK